MSLPYCGKCNERVDMCECPDGFDKVYYGEKPKDKKQEFYKKFIEWFEDNWDFSCSFAKGDLESMYKRYIEGVESDEQLPPRLPKRIKEMYEGEIKVDMREWDTDHLKGTDSSKAVKTKPHETPKNRDTEIIEYFAKLLIAKDDELKAVLESLRWYIKALTIREEVKGLINQKIDNILKEHE